MFLTSIETFNKLIVVSFITKHIYTFTLKQLFSNKLKNVQGCIVYFGVDSTFYEIKSSVIMGESVNTIQDILIFVQSQRLIHIIIM